MRALLPTFAQVLSLGIFILSLTQDSYYIEGNDPRAWSSSAGLLIIGWLGLFYGYFAWLGNPLLFASWVVHYRGDSKLALGLSICSILFMLSFLAHKSIVSSEAPTYSIITGYGLGYWLWLSSAAFSGLANSLALTGVSSGTGKIPPAP